MESNRIQWIDICKGFLIILVVIGHVISSYKGAGVTNDTWNNMSSVIYSFHMACFIFISGFLCRIKSDKSKGYQVRKKLISYGIPYIIFSLIWVVFKLFFAKYTNSSISIYDFLLIFIYPISFMWYLYATMIMNIVQIFIEKYRKIIPVIIIISFILLLIVPLLTNHINNFSDLIICDFMQFWFYFLIGHYYGKRIIEICSSSFIFICSMFLFIVFNILIKNNIFEAAYYYKIITSLSGIVLTIGLFKHIDKNKLLNYCGEKSLSIYVLQGIAIATTRIIINRLGIVNDNYAFISLIICTFFGVLIPLIIEKISRALKFDFIFYPSKYLK